MNRCPAEVWMEILELACDDGGKTGCILSLVSRRMRDLVEPARYYTVSITKGPQLASFAQLVTTRHSPPIIRHLYHCVWIRTANPLDSNKVYEEIRQDARTVFAAAAPNLVTLIAHGAAPDIVGSDIVFPRLRDLSIRGNIVTPTIEAPCFPALRRMHILAKDLESYDYFQFWWNLGKIAPALADLRLSNLSTDFTFDLCSFLPTLLTTPLGVAGTPEPDEARERQRLWVAALPALQRITVSLPFSNKDPPRRISCSVINLSVPHVPTKIVLQRLDALVEVYTAQESPRTLEVWPGSHEYSAEEAYCDWADLVAGGDGPWGASDNN